MVAMVHAGMKSPFCKDICCTTFPAIGASTLPPSVKAILSSTSVSSPISFCHLTKSPPFSDVTPVSPSPGTISSATHPRTEPLGKASPSVIVWVRTKYPTAVVVRSFFDPSAEDTVATVTPSCNKSPSSTSHLPKVSTSSDWSPIGTWI